MNGVDYNIFYKRKLPISGSLGASSWDVFISAFNSSDRVKAVFDRTVANYKFWVIHQEYEYLPIDYPKGHTVLATADEAPSIIKLIETIEGAANKPISSLHICVDITGFMRPHIMFLALYLKRKGVLSFDVLYSEPDRYAKKEKTLFSGGSIDTRQVAGFEGINFPEGNDDLLIIGAGYDHRLIKKVAEYKEKADKIQIFGLPSLRADMYQESVLNANRAADAVGNNSASENLAQFAPASDPFVTATTISEIVKRRQKSKPISNLYLCPLSTKAQALGFALYYIAECEGTYSSIVFPVSSQYTRETSEGISRIWMYTVEYPII